MDLKHTLSFEFFPPKQQLDIHKTKQAVDELSQFTPDFMSVTCGAMGSNNTNSLDILKHIYSLDITPVAHVTCTNATYQSLADKLQEFLDNNICNILALRGDISETSQLTDFKHATDLISHINTHFIFRDKFNLFAAAYPEMHPEAIDFKSDIDFMKRKQDLGVTIFITQLFFDNDVFFRFLSQARSAGITASIIPGVMPVTSYTSIQRIREKTSATFPRQLLSLFNRYKDNKEAITDLGLIYSANQILDLISNDVDGLHIYSMNNAQTTIKLISYVSNALKLYRKIH